jgi:Domain of unknown function (DUF1707)
MLGTMEPGELRAGDADRERVAERLRLALDEGRLNLHEYDERLQEAYAAKTYGELDKLLADLPGVAPASQSQLVPLASGAVAPATAKWQPGPDGHYPDATRRWVAEMWDSWAGAVAICVAIWGVISLISLEPLYFWPGWVAGPWGAVLLVQTLLGLARGEPQRWAAKQARKEAERELRRQAKNRENPAD